jgi:Tfp pilus assembly protein PilN
MNQNNLNTYSDDNEFLDNFKSPAPLNLMMAIYAKELMHKGQLLNFTLFNKPKPLYKRADGRLFISIAAGAILGLIYPIYMLILTFNIEAKSTKLGANLTLQNSSASSLNSSLIALNNEIKSITIQIQNIKDNINKNLATIDIIASKFNNQNLAIILANIANLMDKYSLQARNIELKNNQINIAIISQDTQNINNFINSFSAKTHIGQLISNQNFFESNLTIGQENGF